MSFHEMPFDKLSFSKAENENVYVVAEFVSDRTFAMELKKIEIWGILQKMTKFIFNITSEIFPKDNIQPINVYENDDKTFRMKYDEKLFHVIVHNPKHSHTFSYNQRQIADLIKFLL